MGAYIFYAFDHLDDSSDTNFLLCTCWCLYMNYYLTHPTYIFYLQVYQRFEF